MTKRLLLVVPVVVVMLMLTVGRPGAQEADTVAPKPTVTKVYDVRDLVMPPHDYPRRRVRISRSMGGGKAADYRAVTDAFPIEDEDEDSEPEISCEERLNDLIEAVKQFVEPGSWEPDTECWMRGRRGVMIVRHTAETHAQVQALLTDLRKYEDAMISVRMRLVAPKHADMERILTEKRTLASTPAEKAQLIKLAGGVLFEARFVAMEAQRVPLSAGETIEKADTVDDKRKLQTVKSGVNGWVRPRTTHDGGVRLDLDVTFSKSLGKRDAKSDSPAKTDSLVGSLHVMGSYRMPDGGMFLGPGAGPAGEGGPCGLYALIEVQVIRVPAPK